MRSSTHPWLIALTLQLLCLVSSAQENSQQPAAATEYNFRVGTGRSVITPSAPMWMAGYASRTTPFEDVLLDIWAKAAVIEDATGGRIVLITLDLVGIDKSLSQTICQRLEQKYLLKRSQISIATSHTHTGPVVGYNLRAMHYYQLPKVEQQKILDYSNKLVEQVEQAVGQAIQSLQPAQLKWGSGQTTFGTNRRNNKEADVPDLRSAKRLAGPVDHAVPVMVAYNQQAQPIAILFGYACHATVLSHNRISGDYPGYAQAALEQRFPGATALFWAGCGADINPLPRRSEELAEFYGRQVAAAVESVMMTETLSKAAGPVVHRYTEVPVKLAALPTQEELLRQTQSTNIYEVMRAKLLLEQTESGKSLESTYNYPVLTWQFAVGPQWVHLGGEVVVDYALRIKSEHADSPMWVTAYANDVMAYIPSERVLKEGGYEGATSMVYYGLPTTWAPGIEQTIIDSVNQSLVH